MLEAVARRAPGRRFDRLVITCEHGGNRVPARYARLFAGAADLLESHRGYDIGALAVARRLSRSLQAPLHHATVTRLLVDLNRSLDHPRLFSERVRGLDAAEKQRIVARHYVPHRRRVEQAIAQDVRARLRVLHLAVHSFTPVLDGEPRRADVGLLYDPARSGELVLCQQWKTLLGALAPSLRIRRNYPYRGSADGLTTYLRTCFPERWYLGIELELSQALLGGAGRAGLVRAVEASLRALHGTGASAASSAAGA
jgi:predicted N-formylglutamate amidohydrolase